MLSRLARKLVSSLAFPIAFAFTDLFPTAANAQSLPPNSDTCASDEILVGTGIISPSVLVFGQPALGSISCDITHVWRTFGQSGIESFDNGTFCNVQWSSNAVTPGPIEVKAFRFAANVTGMASEDPSTFPVSLTMRLHHWTDLDGDNTFNVGGDCLFSTDGSPDLAEFSPIAEETVVLPFNAGDHGTFAADAFGRAFCIPLTTPVVIGADDIVAVELEATQIPAGRDFYFMAAQLTLSAFGEYPSFAFCPGPVSWGGASDPSVSPPQVGYLDLAYDLAPEPMDDPVFEQAFSVDPGVEHVETSHAFPQFPVLTLDDFELAENTTVTGVRWSGFFLDEIGNPASPDVIDWLVAFYGDAFGVPGRYLPGGSDQILNSETSSTVSPSVGVAVDGNTLFVDLYTFEATFDRPVVLEAMERYWMGLASQRTNASSPRFYWVGSSDGNKYSIGDPEQGVQRRRFLGGDRTFTLLAADSAPPFPAGEIARPTDLVCTDLGYDPMLDQHLVELSWTNPLAYDEIRIDFFIESTTENVLPTIGTLTTLNPLFLQAGPVTRTIAYDPDVYAQYAVEGRIGSDASQPDSCALFLPQPVPGQFVMTQTLSPDIDVTLDPAACDDASPFATTGSIHLRSFDLATLGSNKSFLTISGIEVGASEFLVTPLQPNNLNFNLSEFAPGSTVFPSLTGPAAISSTAYFSRFPDAVGERFRRSTSKLVRSDSVIRVATLDTNDNSRFVIGRNDLGELAPCYMQGDFFVGFEPQAQCDPDFETQLPPSLANIILELHVDEVALLSAPVDAGMSQTASVDFGPSIPLGVTGDFDNVTSAGEFSVELGSGDLPMDATTAQLTSGVIPAMDPPFWWEVEFSGTFDDNLTLTFQYDPDFLLPGIDGGPAEAMLQMVVLPNPGAVVPSVVDTVNNTITVVLDHLSEFYLVLPDTNLPPAAYCQDFELTLDANGQATLTPSDIDAASADPNGDALTLSLSQTQFDCTDVGPNLVTLTATDPGGLFSQCTATVTVVGANDCDENGTPDVCDIAAGAPDANNDGIPDACQPIFASSCSGDGGDQAGCTNCPCMNNAPQGTVGGCLNSAGTATQLLPSGSNSIGAGDLRFEASGAPPSNSAVLTSGNALAPANMINPCFGLNSGITAIQLDGLRCAVQGVLRHGVRPSDANGDIGVTTNGWGTPNGFFNFAAFVSGNTKHFQIIHRDDIGAVCMRGQNTSQAVSVTFAP